MRKLFFAPFLFLFVAACAPLKSIRYLFPDLNDSAKFKNENIARGDAPFRFAFNTNLAKYDSLKAHIDSSLQNTKTSVFLVIKNDTVVYQYLGGNYALNAKQPSFSMAKSFVGTLVGIAVDNGQLKTSDLVINYLPQLAKNDKRFGKLTVQHLLDMKAGFAYKEKAFTPFSKVTRAYYGANLVKMVQHLKMKNQPGTVFEYQSIVTQVLAMVLEKATGNTLSNLFETQLWKPLGAESDAMWSMDDHGHIKAFCCINATALDFAKLGRLYLKKGNWQGKQIVSKQWIQKTTNPDTLRLNRYKNQFWACRDFHFFKDSLSAKNELKKMKLDYPVERNPDGRYFYAGAVADYKAQGMFGQSIYVNPTSNVIVVRLGDRQKKLNLHAFVQIVGRSF